MIAEGEGELLYDHKPLRVRASDVVYFEPPKTDQLKNDGGRTMVVYSIRSRPCTSTAPAAARPDTLLL